MYETILVATDGNPRRDRRRTNQNQRSIHPRNRSRTRSRVDVRRRLPRDLRRRHSSVRVESTLADTEDVITGLRERGQDILDDIAAQADIDVTIEIHDGRPHEVIGEYANQIDADLLLLGNRGMDSGGQIGSTAERVVRYVDRPVMTA